MKAFTLFISILFTIAGYSQNTINSYKYILVPDKFDFSKEDNQYGLNTTAKQLLEQKGFVVFVGNETLPLIVATNKCNALRAEVTQRKALFATNLTLTLKDCQGNVIYKSKEGKSREKEFQVAYEGALRDAFASLNDLAYKYDSTALAQPQQVASMPAVATPAGASTAAGSPAGTSPATTPASAKPTAAEITGTLYAQATPNGYQLIDTTPKKILTLLKTSMPDYFIAEAGGSNGIVFKKEGGWFFEHYEDSKLVSQKLEIKF